MREKLKIKTKIVVALAALVVAITSVRPAAAQANESYLFLGGVEAMLLGDLDKSSQFFKLVIEKNPIHAPSFFYLGRIALAVGQVDSARDLVDRALKIDSTNATYLSMFVQIQIARKEYQQAEPLMARLREIEPRNQQNYLLGAALLLENRKADQALQLCQQYEQLFGLDERMVEIQRSCYIQADDYFGAEQYMRRVAAAFPADEQHLVALADLNAAIRNDSTALAYYDQAIAIDTTAITARLAKAHFYLVHDQMADYIGTLIQPFASEKMPVEEKIQIFETHCFSPEIYRENFSLVRQLISTLLFSAPQNVDVRMLYGRYLTYSGQIEAAKEHYLSMIEQKVDHKELNDRLLQIYFFQKEYRKALELSTAVNDTNPSAEMMEYRSLAAWLTDDHKEALSLIGEAIRTYRADSVRSLFYALQGDIYDKIGEKRKSYTAYERSLRLDSANAAVLNNYAYHLAIEERELEKALKMAQKANTLSPDNPTYIDTEAWVLFKLGRYVDAQILMRRVITLDGRPTAEVLLHYGDILYALGDDFLARNYWKKAAEAGAEAKDLEPRFARPKAQRPNK